MFHLDQTDRDEEIPIGSWFYKQNPDQSGFRIYVQHFEANHVGNIYEQATADFICEKMNDVIPPWKLIRND